jgi:hypothetical protein
MKGKKKIEQIQANLLNLVKSLKLITCKILDSNWIEKLNSQINK